MTQIRFCARFLSPKYDDVAQIGFCVAYVRWECEDPRIISTIRNSAFPKKL